jgi:hypothetical protein
MKKNNKKNKHIKKSNDNSQTYKNDDACRYDRYKIERRVF